MSKGQTVPKCPHCASTDVSEYVYGLPDYIEFQKLEARGRKFIFAGCTINGDESDYKCNTCGLDFNSHPDQDFNAADDQTI